MTRWSLCLLLLLGLSLPVFAQTPEPLISRDVAVFAAGVNPNTGTPLAGTLANIPNSGWACGLSKTTVTGTVSNPTDLWIDDPADSTKDCKLATAASASLFGAVPTGLSTTLYTVAVKARGATTAAAWSAVGNPFNHVAVAPAVATGVRVQ